MGNIDLSNFDNDILWLVFMTIASSEDHKSIRCIHNCLQVCWTWQHIITRSTVLWGRLLWIDSNNLSHSKWSDYFTNYVPEVLKRSGSSPLWVRGTLTPDFRWYFSECWERDNFFHMIEQNWGRIEHMDLTIQGAAHLSQAGNRWKVFSQPAPLLRQFRLFVRPEEYDSYYMRDEPKLSPPSMDDAPLLRSFSSNFFTDWAVIQRHTKPWLANLRHLSTSGDFITSFTDLMTILGMMKPLETLRIGHRIDEQDGIDSDSGWPISKHSIDLPCLTTLAIHGPLNHCMWLMHSINPTAQSTFSFLCDAVIPETIHTSYDILLEEFQVEFSKMIEHFASVHRHILPFGQLHLAITKTLFHFGNKQQEHKNELSMFSITIRSQPKLYRLHTIKHLLNTFSSIYLEDTSSLHLAIDERASTAKDLFPSYMPLFHTISSVETLSILSWEDFFNFYSFSRRTFQAYDPRFPVIFPELKSLNLERTYGEREIRLSQYTVADTLRLFLLDRAEVGYPVDMLRLITDSMEARKILQKDLGDIPGLKINWEQIEKVHVSDRTGR